MLDVHLMIERPERQVAEFAKAGADSITFHFEATAPRRLRAIHRSASTAPRAGLAVNPGTPVEALAEVGDASSTSRCA